MFTTNHPERAIFHNQHRGPYFSHALVVFGPILNEGYGGRCFTEGKRDDGKYNVPADQNGRNPLTGSSFIDDRGRNAFTCLELEVFALE